MRLRTLLYIDHEIHADDDPSDVAKLVEHEVRGLDHGFETANGEAEQVSVGLIDHAAWKSGDPEPAQDLGHELRD